VPPLHSFPLFPPTQSLLFDLDIESGWRQNNRVENSHQPVRQRERGLQRFKSLRHAARFRSMFSTVCNQFRPGRRALSAPHYRTVMRRPWREWGVVSETTAFAVAA
jgi:putative transposase